MFMSLLAVLPVLLAAFPFRSRKENTYSYISKDTALCMKGLAALTVILHHLSQRTSSGSTLFVIYIFSGVYAVSCFLFYTGYGFMKNCVEKPSYESGFLRRRTVKLMAPYILLTFIYRFLWKWEGTEYSAADIVRRILAGDPIDLFSWYVWFILIFCVFFALAMKVTEKDERKMIIAACLFWLVWYGFCRLMNYGIWWYDTAHIAVMGMLWHRHEEKILLYLKRYRLPAVIAGSLLIVIVSPLSLFSPFVWQLPLYILSTVIFVFVMNAILLKHSPCNKILKFLGTVSYELYLVHGLFVIGFRGVHIFVESDALYTVLVPVLSVGMAALLHALMSILPVRRSA